MSILLVRDVMTIGVPICAADELQALFGPATRLLCEDEEGALLSFWVSDGQLGSARVAPDQA